MAISYLYSIYVLRELVKLPGLATISLLPVVLVIPAIPVVRSPKWDLVRVGMVGTSPIKIQQVTLGYRVGRKVRIQVQ